MSDQAEREMTLDEFVGRLNPNHFACRELVALRTQLRTLSDREKVLERALATIANGPAHMGSIHGISEADWARFGRFAEDEARSALSAEKVKP